MIRESLNKLKAKLTGKGPKPTVLPIVDSNSGIKDALAKFARATLTTYRAWKDLDDSPSEIRESNRLRRIRRDKKRKVKAMRRRRMARGQNARTGA